MEQGDRVLVTMRRPDRRGCIPTEEGTIRDFSTTGNLALVTIARTGEIVGRWLCELVPA